MANPKALSGLALLEAQFWPSIPSRDCNAEFPPDEDGVQRLSNLDARGRELPDPVPMAPPVGYRDGPSLAEFVQRMIRQEVSEIARQNDLESFDDADDFDIEDDLGDADGPPTIYEAFLDQSTGRPFVAPGEPSQNGSPPAKPPAPSPAPDLQPESKPAVPAGLGSA